MYTVSVADVSPQSFSLPPSQVDALVYNSSWTNKRPLRSRQRSDLSGIPERARDLFMQAGPGSTTHPYMTTSGAEALAGFFPKEAFAYDPIDRADRRD